MSFSDNKSLDEPQSAIFPKRSPFCSIFRIQVFEAREKKERVAVNEEEKNFHLFFSVSR